ncbi:MAG: RagB/SusD family nutrient uptake outer membrane protein [Chitinophagaceae bacterium]|nr:RagB/SusD family nutrient uptake outer membrane protein [Chitinophagaceae bacterium]
MVPSTLADAQALIDNYGIFNTFYPYMGMQSDDDFYLLDTYWSSITNVDQNNYIWAKENYNLFEWGNIYQKVLHANLVLETIAQIQPTSNTFDEINRIRGAALFNRGYAFYNIAQYYTIPYEKNLAASSPGIPLRLNTNPNEISTRSTLKQTYEQIISDFSTAAAILPVITSPVSRPSKPAAFAALARIYLTMDDYLSAKLYADSCLQLYNTLMDYNIFSSSSTQPFPLFNSEVIFPAVTLQNGVLSVTNWKADSILYQSYSPNDLRRTLFYQSNGPGTFGFKGSYDGSANPFIGIATDEVYLIRAECKARTGDKDGSMTDLNTLLVKRWKTGTFIPYTASDPSDALVKVLSERRKELVLRGSRWFDLRRLNKDPRFAKTLTRKINGQIYQLPPNDPRYTFYIPLSVIALTGIPQNSR